MLGFSMDSVIDARLQAQFQTQLQEEVQTVNDSYNDKMDFKDAQTDRWIDVLGSVTNAKMAMESANETMDEVDTALLELRSKIGDARDAVDPEPFNELYNEAIAEMNRDINLYGPSYNPIGRVDPITWEANDITYYDTLSKYEKSLTGTNISNDFRILSDDGTIWVTNSSSNTIEQYEDYNIEEGHPGFATEQESSISTGLKLVSYDEATGAIEMTANVEGTETTITGTLERGGMGLMQSWFYNDFATAEDATRAMDDLNDAENQLTYGRSVVGGHLATTKMAERRINEEMDDLADDKKDLLYAQLKEQQEIQLSSQRQYQAMVLNLENIRSQQSNYASVFGSLLAKDPILNLSV